MSRLLLAFLLVAVFAPSALAQPNPEGGGEPIALASGFAPDPYAVDVTAGGPEATVDVSPDCPGYVSTAPSAVFDYGGSPGHLLRFFVRSSTDTVLLVHTPGGLWLCNDDDEGLNPGLDMEPATGRYAVWVGVFSDEPGAETPATLYVSGSEQATPALVDPDAVPAANTLTLEAGFAPDPHERAVTAGGTTPAQAYDESCFGFIDPATPSAAIDYETDGAGPLYVYARTEGDDDLTLVVLDPDGTFHCNDDAADLNPGLVVEPAAGGRYLVWVGTYTSRARTEAPGRAALLFSGTEGPTAEEFIEEDYYDDGTYEGGEDLSRFAAPAHGTLTLAAGFGAEQVSVEAGGGDAVSVSGAGCVGFISNGAPDLNVMYGGVGDTLSFYTDSNEDDLTMVVNLPDGSWRCNDDTLDRNPAVVVEAPEGGLYNVWVGTYSQGAGSEATLHVSESAPR